ncbi:hypothetical protein TWF694_010903 [Orbilia ellipsospora]|uniref:Uncharacterized protein n=1 Tax=Orbilia ellipsospora TaxID=2528407 RepID=A0AAV9X7F3_9PEZI
MVAGISHPPSPSISPWFINYQWEGKIGADPSTPIEDDYISLVKLVPQDCEADDWVKWRVSGFWTGVLGEFDAIFKGFIEHIRIEGYCIVYNLESGWDASTTLRGNLGLADCSELKRLYLGDPQSIIKDDDDIEMFLNAIRYPTKYKYNNFTISEVEDMTTMMSRRFYPLSKTAQLDLEGDEGNGTVSIPETGVCGRYGKFGKILDRATKLKANHKNVTLPDWSNWSIVAEYYPDDSCTTYKDTGGSMITKCPSDDDKVWQWGCGLASVELNPPFVFTRNQTESVTLYHAGHMPMPGPSVNRSLSLSP